MYFENELRRYFTNELGKIYYAGSAINSAFQKIDTYTKKEAEFQEKNSKGEFTGKNQIESAKEDIARAKAKAEKALKDIEGKRKAKDNDVVNRVFKHIEQERIEQNIAIDNNTLKEKTKVRNNKNKWRVDKLSSYSKNERKLISKIFDIIAVATDAKIAELIIQKIEEELK